MQVVRQDNAQHRQFLKALLERYELIAPVKKDLARFEKLNDVEDVYLEKNTYFPLKEFFFRKREVLFVFKGNELTEPKLNPPERVFYGIRKCDLNAIHHQDTVFINDANDPYYAKMREKSFLLGYHCNTAPSPYCFCMSLPLVEFFDLMFYNKGDHFLVEIGSEKGKLLVEKFGQFFGASSRMITQQEKYIPGADRLDKKDISKLYDHPDWKQGVDECLSCGACTNLCPTCYCHEVHDETSLKDPKSGERVRSWSSCQLQEFTKVAGDHVFRKNRDERFKHRIYHQLEYFKEKYGVPLCVGCGRCISGCPTRIDFVEIINKMKTKTEGVN